MYLALYKKFSAFLFIRFSYSHKAKYYELWLLYISWGSHQVSYDSVIFTKITLHFPSENERANSFTKTVNSLWFHVSKLKSWSQFCNKTWSFTSTLKTEYTEEMRRKYWSAGRDIPFNVLWRQKIKCCKSGAHKIFQNSKSNLKILGTKVMTSSNVYTQDLKLWGDKI